MMQDTTDAAFLAPKKRMSTGAKFAIGCGVTLLLLVLICSGLIYAGYRYTLGEYVDAGYSIVFEQAIVVSTPVTQPTAFFGQHVSITAPVTANIAMVTQSADIQADITGDIDFSGQTLTIHEGVTVTGNINVKSAQSVVNRGTVTGTITGNFPGSNATAPAP